MKEIVEALFWQVVTIIGLWLAVIILLTSCSQIPEKKCKYWHTHYYARMDATGNFNYFSVDVCDDP